MDRNTYLLNKRLLDFHTEAISDLSFTEINIKEKSLKSPGLKTKWLMCYLEEKKFLAKLKDVKKSKLDEYITKHGQLNIPKISTIKLAESDSELVKLDLAIKEQGDVVEFLSGMLDIFKNIGFDIRNTTDLLKIES